MVGLRSAFSRQANKADAALLQFSDGKLERGKVVFGGHTRIPLSPARRLRLSHS